MGAFSPQFTLFLILLPLVATNAILYLWLGEQDSWLPSKPTPLLLHGLVSRSAVQAASSFSLETKCIASTVHLDCNKQRNIPILQAYARLKRLTILNAKTKFWILIFRMGEIEIKWMIPLSHIPMCYPFFLSKLLRNVSLNVNFIQSCPALSESLIPLICKDRIREIIFTEMNII